MVGMKETVNYKRIKFGMTMIDPRHDNSDLNVQLYLDGPAHQTVDFRGREDESAKVMLGKRNDGHTVLSEGDAEKVEALAADAGQTINEETEAIEIQHKLSFAT